MVNVITWLYIHFLLPKGGELARAFFLSLLSCRSWYFSAAAIKLEGRIERQKRKTMGGGPIFPTDISFLEEAFCDEQMIKHEERDDKQKSRETYMKESKGNQLKDLDGKKKKMKNEKKNDTDGTQDAEKLKKKLLKLDHKLEKIILKKKDCLQKLAVIEGTSDERKDEASFDSRVKECTCKAEESEATKSKQKKERKKQDKKQGKSSVEKLNKRLAELYGRLGYLLSETQDYLQEMQHGDAEVPLRTHHKPKDRKMEPLL